MLIHPLTDRKNSVYHFWIPLEGDRDHQILVFYGKNDIFAVFRKNIKDRLNVNI